MLPRPSSTRSSLARRHRVHCKAGRARLPEAPTKPTLASMQSISLRRRSPQVRRLHSALFLVVQGLPSRARRLLTDNVDDHEQWRQLADVRRQATFSLPAQSHPPSSCGARRCRLDHRIGPQADPMRSPPNPADATKGTRRLAQPLDPHRSAADCCDAASALLHRGALIEGIAPTAASGSLQKAGVQIDKSRS